jgi:sorbose reductase
MFITKRKASASCVRSFSRSLVRYEPTITQRTFTSSVHLRDPAAEVKITDRLSMKGKNVLITGGGRGIGLAIAKALAQLGSNIAVLDALPEPTKEFHALSGDYGIKTVYERLDVTVQSSLEAGFENVVQRSGSIHGLVTAAGITLERPFVEHTWDECKKLLDVNVMGTFWAAKLAADHFKARGEGGSMVFIASVAAQGIIVPMQSLAIYNMSKAAVKGLVGPLAVELGEDGIRVNSISPGVIDSQMTRDNATMFPRLTDMYHNAPPMRRIGQPSDLTPMVAYLLSDASTFTTGSDILITGGLHSGLSPKWVDRS